MKLQKFRWSKVYESSEEELVQFLDARGIDAERWTADEFHSFGQQIFAEDTTIWCAEGSLTFHIDDKNISMQPGDGLVIPGHVDFEATAGMSGCVCFESHKQS